MRDLLSEVNTLDVHSPIQQIKMCINWQNMSSKT